MMATTVLSEITDLVARIVGVDAALVTPEACFVDLGRTSYHEVEMLVAIEDDYHITVDFSTYLSLETVGALADAIAAATRDRRAPAAAEEAH
jgi:acyl carrier protein